MLCQKCNKNTATFFYTETVNGKTASYALCDECKKKFTGGEGHSAADDGFEKLYNGFFNDSFFMPSLFPSSVLFGNADMLAKASGSVKKCPSCGASLYELTNAKRGFCPECYIAFSDELAPYFKNMHGSYLHKGRRPMSQNVTKTQTGSDNTSKNDNSNEKELAELREKLNEAIQGERYEDAAKLRDRIRQLEA